LPRPTSSFIGREQGLRTRGDSPGPVLRNDPEGGLGEDVGRARGDKEHGDE
jgi:hypothetical protein